jgi:hypothetical protein
VPYTAAPTVPAYGFPEPARLVWDNGPEAMRQSAGALLQQLEMLLWTGSGATCPDRVRAEPLPSDEARADRAGAAEVVGDLARAGESVLAQIETLEVAKAQVEADLLAAYAALHTIESQQLEALPAGSASRSGASGGRVATGRIVGEEIALATGVGVGEVARRLALATAPRRHARMLTALRAGTTSLHRALQVTSETVDLCDADVALVEDAVLAPSRDGRVCSQRTFVTRLRRAIASLDARGADERRALARNRRGVFGRMTGDGMGCLTVVTGADAIAAIMDRLDGQARSARSGGDVRTPDQLRCDLATEALLRSHHDATQPGSTAGSNGVTRPSTSAGRNARMGIGTGLSTRSRMVSGTDANERTGPGTGPSTCGAGADSALTGSGRGSFLSPDDALGRDLRATGPSVAPDPGHPPHPPAPPDPPLPREPPDPPEPSAPPVTGHPAALVWIVVPFDVAIGASHAACELPGHGWVTAAHAREIITRPGSVWRTLPVDVRSGRALSRPTSGYRPTAEMVEYVEAVDGTCRAPGCEVPAVRCDLDHEIPWPAGPTTVDNLHAKHRFHHNLKTDGAWSSVPTGERGLEWTTLAGRTYATQPKDWRAGVDQPPRAIGTAADEPPPF